MKITLTPEMVSVALKELQGFAYSDCADVSEFDIHLVESAIRECLRLAPEGAVEVVSDQWIHKPNAVRIP